MPCNLFEQEHLQRSSKIRPQTASLKASFRSNLLISYSQALGPFQRVQPMLEGPQFVASLATGHLFHSKKNKNQNTMQSVFPLVEVFQLLKWTLTAVTYQLQNVNMFLVAHDFFCHSVTQIITRRRQTRGLSGYQLQLGNPWTLGFFITTWIISNISRSHCDPCLLCEKCI